MADVSRRSTPPKSGELTDSDGRRISSVLFVDDGRRNEPDGDGDDEVEAVKEAIRKRRRESGKRATKKMKLRNISSGRKPHVKLIVLMRDPVERVISRYREQTTFGKALLAGQMPPKGSTSTAGGCRARRTSA